MNIINIHSPKDVATITSLEFAWSCKYFDIWAIPPDAQPQPIYVVSEGAVVFKNPGFEVSIGRLDDFLEFLKTKKGYRIVQKRHSTTKLFAQFLWKWYWGLLKASVKGIFWKSA